MLKFLLKSAFRAVRASYNTPERIGARGEHQVHHVLASALSGDDYRVLSDLILPLAGGTTQVDHIVLSRFGIFVIETKHMSGWIFGDANQRKWTQVHKRSRRSFQNPLRQNYAHLKAVEEILKVDQGVLHNIVVFTGAAEPRTAMPDCVAWGLQDLGKLVARQKEPVLTDAQVSEFAQNLSLTAFENTAVARKEHVKNLEARATSVPRVTNEDPVGSPNPAPCPRCGSNMVERRNRKTGDVFWGCLAFPKCRGSRRAVRYP